MTSTMEEEAIAKAAAAANNDEQQQQVDDDDDDDDEDLEKLQAEIARMEEQAARIAKENEELQRKRAKVVGAKADDSATKAAASSSEKTQLQRDGNSIYVGQVDYATTPEELLAHFEACGSVERVTIVCDKFTGRPKGFAYLEFESESAVENAMKLDGSEFKGRNLKVTAKRVNQPFMGASAPRGGGRGGGFYRGGRGAYRGGGRGGRGRGGFRGGGRGHHPYY